MQCQSCNTPYTCASEKLCAPKPSPLTRRATWTDSPPLPSEPAPSKEPRWTLWALCVGGAIALVAKFLFT